MRLEVIVSDFMASLKTFGRSKGTIFWTMAFPILLMLIFGAIFSGTNDTEYELYIQDLDDSESSRMFIDILEETGLINIKKVDIDKDVEKYIENNDIKRLLLIPENYGEKIIQSFTDAEERVNISFYFDQSEQTTNQIVRSIISNVVQIMNMNMTGGRNIYCFFFICKRFYDFFPIIFGD